MQTHTFIKEDNRWYIDLPEYLAAGGAKGELQMVEGADTMLEIMANERDHVTLTLDTKPFAGSDELSLVELCDPVIGGGIYLLETFEGRRLSHKMWLCPVTEFVFGGMPDNIYIKQSHE